MPLYDFECNCGYSGEHITKIDAILNCPKCNQHMERLMPSSHGINMGAAGAYGYYDNNLECYISTNHQRREVMRKKGVQEKIGKNWY